MRNVFAALSRAARPTDLTTATDVPLAARSQTKKRARLLGGIVSSLSTAFRPSSSRSSGSARPRRFATTVAAATLAGFAGNPLAVENAGALLKERLSRNKRKRFSDAQESVSTELEGIRISIEDRPSPRTLPDADFHSELGYHGSSREELDEARSSREIPNNSHTEPAPVSEFKDNSGWVMITQAPSPVDPLPALSESTRSLGVYRRDFAYPSSSSLGSSAAQAQAQAQTPLHPSISNTSFVTALTSLTFDASPRSSVVSRVPFVIGNRCESPAPIAAFKRPPPARRPSSSLRVSTATDAGGESNNGISRLVEEHGRPVFDLPSAVTEESSASTAVDERDTMRRALIIGNSYRTRNRRTHTTYSIKTLPGTENDIPLLKEVFEGRGYDVEVFNHDGFRREEVLERVAAFLHDAKPGHIRAIAFIGHACLEDEKIVLVPPHCPVPELAIPQVDWEHTIRTNATAGSIVFSIMAHCFSGAFMKQEQDCQTWKTQGPVPLPHPAIDRPVFVTFASSTGIQSSFESTVEPEAPERAQDHFLYALAMTMKTDTIHTWEEFFAGFRHHFDRARSGASWAERFDPEKHLPEGAVPASSESEHIPAWRPANRQDPIFSASEILGYSNMFKLPVLVS